MSDILVTSYMNPDLDGVACAYAYVEFLRKTGTHAEVKLFGRPHKEAQFVLRELGVSESALQNETFAFNEKTPVILVDTARAHPSIHPLQVIEIIDHREVHEADRFPHAKKQIELVGAAATLIAERFYKDHVPISKEAALLLYGAIVSNTINFQARMTTERDREMACWLRDRAKIPAHFVDEMFAFKSVITESMKDVFLEDFVKNELSGYVLTIAQLEIIDALTLAHRRKEEIIQALQDIQQEFTLEYIFLSCIDIREYFNVFITHDAATQELLQKILSVTFEDGIAKRSGVIMRKELLPMIRDALKG